VIPLLWSWIAYYTNRFYFFCEPPDRSDRDEGPCATAIGCHRASAGPAQRVRLARRAEIEVIARQLGGGSR